MPDSSAIADPGAGMGSPEQQGAPSWGTIAMPAVATGWNPGATVIGQGAEEASYNARRAQNLAAFDAFQRDNPGATAADLTQAYEKLTGGANYFGGPSPGGKWGVFGSTPAAPAGGAPGVGTPGGGAVSGWFQQLAAKNQMSLQSAQAVQQGNITKGFTDALTQSTETANSKDEWLKGAKSLLPQSLQPGFDTWMAGQNTDQMFQVYQQHRVTPIIASGVANLWDDPKSYIMAAGGNETLGKMAYDLAKPQVDAKKAENAAGLAEKGAATQRDLAGAAAERATTQRTLAAIPEDKAKSDADVALAAAEAEKNRAETAKTNQETKDAIVKAGGDKVLYANSYLTRPDVAKAISSGDKSQMDHARASFHNEMVLKYGSDWTPEMEDAWWATAPSQLAAQRSSEITAKADQQAKDNVTADIIAPTDGIRNVAANQNAQISGEAIDQQTIDNMKGLDAQQKQAAKVTALAWTRELLANKGMAFSDRDAFMRIVATGAAQGKSYNEVEDELRKPSAANGRPIYGLVSDYYSAIAKQTPGYGMSPVSVPEMQRQLTDTTTNVSVQTNTLIRTLTKGGPPATGWGSDIQGRIDMVTAARKAALDQIDERRHELQNPDTEALFYDKDKNGQTMAYLDRLRNQVLDDYQNLQIVLKQHPELKTTESTTATTAYEQGQINVNGSNISINTSPSSVPDGAVRIAQSEVATQAAAQQAVPGTTGKAPSVSQAGLTGNVLDPGFIAMVQNPKDPRIRQLAALGVQEANHALAAAQSIAQPDITPEGYTGTTIPLRAPPSRLAVSELTAIARKLVESNGKGYSPQTILMLEDSLTKYLILEQTKGMIAPPAAPQQ